jgi:release factor glutamine methyltransferase
MNALAKIREISKALAASGIETADKEAELLVLHCLGISMVDLYKINPSLKDKQIMDIDEMAGRRSRREPLQYILGYSYFMGLKILLGSGVLIPRPETELMAEYAIKRVTSYELRVKGFNPDNPELSTLKPIQNSPLRILDLCTGTGCLALALAKEFPYAHVFGTDISETALRYAEKNAQVNGIDNVSFIKGHLFEPFVVEENINPPSSPFSKGGLNSPLSRGVRGVFPSLVKRGEGRFFDQNAFDLIISNPPYIRTDEIKTLQPEIRDWEPIGALDGGADGLNFYREIIPQAGKFLKTNGILMLELGAGCADETVQIMKDAGYAEIGLRKDYAGIERIIQGKWTN